LALWGLVAIGFLALIPGLDARGHWESADGRPPLVGRDILATGRLQPPFLAGQPYLNKPPLYHALVAASFAAWGEGRVSARLPATLAALIAVMLTAVLAARVAGRRAGIAAGLLLLLTHRFFTMGRSSELETLLVACAAMNYVGMDAALRFQGARRIRGIVLASCGAAIAAWTKGPLLALLFPAVFAAGAAATRRSWRAVATSGLMWTVIGALAATCVYYAPMYFSEQTRAALEDRLALRNNSHQRGFFYYFEKLPVGMLPASLLVPWMWSAARREWRLVGHWIVAAGFGFVVFSAFPAKQSHYLLPLYPLLCAWAGVAALRLLASPARWPFLVCGAVTAAVGIIGAPVAHGMFDALPVSGLTLGIAVITAVLGVATLSATVRAGDNAPARSRRNVGLLTAGALLSGLLTFDTYQAYVRDGERSAEPAMSAFRAVVGDAPLASLDRKATVLYYLARRDIALPADAALAAAFLRAHPDGYVVIQHEQGDVVPAALATAPTAARWSSRSGRRGFLLLGPGPGD